MDYAFGFSGETPRETPRKARKPKVKAPQQAITPQQEAPVVNPAGRWVQVNGKWVFQKGQPTVLRSPIVIHARVLPGFVPAPETKAPVMPAPRPVRIVRQHSAKRGPGLTRRPDR